MVDYLWDFSRILAWYLKDTGYFSTEVEQKQVPGHEPRILDMSPGGMLMSLPARKYVLRSAKVPSFP